MRCSKGMGLTLVQAHFQKAKIYAKQGEFETAEGELRAFGKTKADPAAEELVSSWAWNRT